MTTTDPSLPVLVMTGPVAGTIRLSDGTDINVTPALISIDPQHLDELAHHQEQMLEQSGALTVPGPDGDRPFTHDRVGCGFCPDTAPSGVSS